MDFWRQKQYDRNYDIAVSELEEQFGKDIFSSFPEIAKEGLIEQKRQILNTEFERLALEETIKRKEKAKKISAAILAKGYNFSEEDIGYVKTYHKFKSVSLGFQEDSLQLTNPNLFLGGRLLGFHKDQILGLKDRIHEIITEAYTYKPREKTPVSYAYFRVFNNDTVVGSTPTQFIHLNEEEEDLNSLCKRFDDLIELFNSHQYHYQYLFSTEQNQCNAVLYFTSLYFPSPKDHTKWGDNIESNLKFSCFQLFTANTDGSDCVQQCGRFLDRNLDAKTLTDITDRFNNHVLIFNLADHIKNVQDIKNFYDLRIDPNSPIKEFNVINPTIKYLLSHNGHIGVMHKLRKQKFTNKFTTFSPLQFRNKVKKVTVCFDIECYFDPKIEKDQRHIPYLACACFILDDKIQFSIEEEGENCVFKIIDTISDIAKDLKIKSIELVAHNGGNYDFHYIISNMYNPASIKNILMRNNAFISFEFNHNEISFYVKDSYSFLLCSLANAAKAFDVDGGKTDFPHHEVKSKEDLEKVFNKWKSVNTIIDSHIEKQKMIITAQHFIRYDSHKDSRKLIEWAKEYCMNDVIVLANVWKKFKYTTFDIFGAHIVDQTKTLAGLSFKLFEAFLDSDIKLYHPVKEDYLNIRNALIGGRCISENGIHDNVLCLDVKSLYPAAMAYYDQPYGKMFKVKDRNHDKLGVYYCKVKAYKQDSQQFFPIRYNDKVVYKLDNSIEYQAWYTSVDIDIGLEEGHEIEILGGYEWESKGKIFKNYIEQVLYKYKLQFENEDNKVKRQVIKIIMNSLWGKFAQKWIDDDYEILNIQDAENKEGHIIWDTEYMLVKNKLDKDQGGKPIQNGVFTLSYARLHMKKLWQKGAKNNTKCLYSDTDSICVYEKDFDLSSEIIGDEMGLLELEHNFVQLICTGKKQYMGSYIVDDEIRYKKRFKGVPLQYITPDLYIHLLEDKKAVVEFLKFRREWGSVRGYIEQKNLRMT
nr:DNA polymerase [Saccharomycopsis crataegensis]